MSDSPDTPNAQASNADDEFTPWRCGDEYQHVPMKKGSDPEEHWKTVAEHLMEREKGRCEAWKDEVDKLLVFAGLFSAVVTGLLVESYKSLSEDPIEAMLAQLVAQGSNQTTVAIATSGNSGRFAASESSKRVNALWFLSLVLSLATALFGIVAQQWLREHIRASPQNTPILQLAAQLQMQADALDRFLVPQLFALLPLLLIISLVLFLIGLADFVWALNHQIAIPVLVASIFVFCFLLFTTLYTSFQALPCEVPRSRSSPTPRTPCPYKSPQSWACFKVVLVLKELFYFSMWCTTELLSRVPSLGIVDDVDTIPFEQLKHGWINQATLWLRQRDLDVLKFYADEELLPLSDDISNPDYAVVSAGLYDTVASLQTAKSELSLAKSNRLSHVFQCFQDLTSIPDQAQSLLPSVRWKHDLRIQYLLTEVLTIDGRLVTPYPRDGFTLAEKQFALDNTRLWFLLDEAFSIRVVTPHHLELLVRVLRWLVEHVDVKFVLPVSESLGLFSKPFPVKFLLINASNQTSEPLQRTLRSQFGAILTGFFDLASNHRPPVEEIGQTLLTTTYLQGLLETASFLSRDTTSFGQFKAAVMPKLISYFAQGQKREQVPEKSPDSDTTSPELEFLLVSVAIFMNELMFYPNSLTPEEKHGVFKGLSDCNKSCDQTYIRTLLGSVLYYDDRVWPMDFIDYHLSNLPALQAVQVRHSTDSASKHHISVDFSTSPGPYVPYDDLSHSQVLETSHTHTETSASPNINSQIVGPRRAWRSQPISLRHDEKHSDLNVWDASL